MKLTCDLCGGELQMNPDGAVCCNCGLEYGEDRIREKMAEQKPVPGPKPPVRKDPPAPKKPTAAEQKAQKKMKTMWIILAAIGLFAFFSTLFTDSALPLVSFPALLITLFIFKPWKVYGGKAI